MSVRGHAIAAIVAGLFSSATAVAVAAGTDPHAVETLGAWPCLDAPGCESPAPALAQAPKPQVAAPVPSEPSLVPLPAALTLLGAGMVALAMIGRRR